MTTHPSGWIVSFYDVVAMISFSSLDQAGNYELLLTLEKNQVVYVDSLLSSCSPVYLCLLIPAWSVDDKLQNKPKHPLTGSLVKLMLISNVKIITRSFFFLMN